MERPPTADRSQSAAPTLPRRVPVDAGPGRLPPLGEPQREAVDTFLSENRQWALRQARRSYRHLPESLREQAVDRAFTELRTRAPSSLERRALAADLAERLTDALRHVHVGWCLNESSALLRREGTEPVEPDVRREDLAVFVDEGLGGLERAVMQLEIGAGRDTRTARAALRLGPRQYATHRNAGLSKLRDAISAQVIGRACDQHVSSIVAAATGDKTAMEELNAGPHRCRYCAREAQGLRSVLHERLAVAPWPIVIKPAGLLAAKLGAIGGVGALGGGGGSGTTAAATVLAAAALATGTVAVVDSGDAEPERARDRPVQADSTSRAAMPAAPKRSAVASHTTIKAPTGGGKAPDPSRKAQSRPADTGAGTGAGAGAQTPAVASDPGAPASTAPDPATTAAPAPVPEASDRPVSAVVGPLTGVVNEATDQVTDVLPPLVGEPLDETVTGVTDVANDATGVLDSLVP